MSIFFAITKGLTNIAVSRLTQTWDRLSSKVKRTFSQYESLAESSRNFRRYRLYLSRLEPPIVPFATTILKDVLLAHEGNQTYLDKNLVNFEKMVGILNLFEPQPELFVKHFLRHSTGCVIWRLI